MNNKANIAQTDFHFFFICGMWCPGCAKNLQIALNKEYPNNKSIIDYSTGTIETNILDELKLNESIRKLGFKLVYFQDINELAEIQEKETSKQTLNLALSLWTMNWGILFNYAIADNFTTPINFVVNLFLLLFIIKPLSHSLFIGLKSLKNLYPNIDSIISLVFFSNVALAITSLINQTNIFYFDSFFMTFFIFNLVRYMEYRSTRKPFYSKDLSQIIQNSFYFASKTYTPEAKFLKKKIRNLKVGMVINLKAGDIVPANFEILNGRCELSNEIVTGESDQKTCGKKDQLLYGSYIKKGNIFAQIVSFDKNDLDPYAKSNKRFVSKMSLKIDSFLEKGFWSVIAIAFFVGLGKYLLTHNYESALTAFNLTLLAINICLFYLIPTVYDFKTRLNCKLHFTSNDFLCKYQEVEHFIFDKTGTLEKSAGNVSLIKNQTLLSDTDVFSLLGAMEEGLPHPIAKALLAYNHEHLIKNIEIQSRNTTEKSVEVITVDNVNWHFGKRDKNGDLILESDQQQAAIRIDFKEDLNMINYLRELSAAKKHIYILTGDSKINLERFVKKHHFSSEITTLSDMSSDDKIQFLSQLKHKTCSFVDGINDIKLAKHSFLSISMAEASTNLKLISDAIYLNKPLSHNKLNMIYEKVSVRLKLITILISLIYVGLIYSILKLELRPAHIIVVMFFNFCLIMTVFIPHRYKTS